MALRSIADIEEKVAGAVSLYNTSVAESERIASVSLFGSYAKGMAHADSDIDLLDYMLHDMPLEAILVDDRTERAAAMTAINIGELAKHLLMVSTHNTLTTN